jgi:hypothetical protein
MDDNTHERRALMAEREKQGHEAFRHALHQMSGGQLMRLYHDLPFASEFVEEVREEIDVRARHRLRILDHLDDDSPRYEETDMDSLTGRYL